MLCEIFKNNTDLLRSKIDTKIINELIKLIEFDGRNSKPLDFFLTIIKEKQGDKHKFLFEN